MSNSSIGVALGIVLLLIVFLWNKFAKPSLQGMTTSVDDLPRADETQYQTPIQESIRQIALIEKDEFRRFYQPIIEKVELYDRILGAKKIDRQYFETIYKALRKRRSAIFEYGSSERDQEMKSLWTFALFTTLTLRYIIKRYQAVEIKLGSTPINPFLYHAEVLSNCAISPKISEQSFQADSLNIHLIDKVIEPVVIERFSKAGIYAYIVNGVSGYYQERINPFYTIIEQVEGHVAGQTEDATLLFKNNLQQVLDLIQRNTFAKNTVHSLIFEGTSFLLIDRNFLWELYRGYAVCETKPIGKKEFEAQLAQVLNLGKPLEQEIIYRVSIESDQLDEDQEGLNLELRNMVALPYNAVPYYHYSDSRRIQKKSLQRDVVVNDNGREMVGDHSIVSRVDENRKLNGASFTVGTPGKVGLKDLFSDQQ